MSTVEEIVSAVKDLPPHELAEVKRQVDVLVGPVGGDNAPLDETGNTADLDRRIQRALYEAGLIREIKPPAKRPRGRRPPIKIKGKPLSETIIEDRR